METKMTIGKELTIYSYSTVQKGYGRQGLYLSFFEIEGEYYMQDVYPNVTEGLGILLSDYSFSKNRDKYGRFCKEYYTDVNGNGQYERPYDTVEDFLKEKFQGVEIEIEIEEDEDEE